jgi:hypothetical protein
MTGRRSEVKTMQNLIKTTVLGLIVVLSACDKEKTAAKDGGKKAPPAAQKTPDAEGGGNQVEAEAPSLDPKVEQAVNLANKISAEPESADSILEAEGMDREAFEKLLYEIARDPELSKSYAVAREA